MTSNAHSLSLYYNIYVHTFLWCVQLTWIPNELEGFDVVVFEYVERLSEPRGWLYKLWEVVVPGGLLILSSSHQHWTHSNIQLYIGKWCIAYICFPFSLLCILNLHSLACECTNMSNVAVCTGFQ